MLLQIVSWAKRQDMLQLRSYFSFRFGFFFPFLMEKAVQTAPGKMTDFKSMFSVVI